MVLACSANFLSNVIPKHVTCFDLRDTVKTLLALGVRIRSVRFNKFRLKIDTV